MRHKFWDLRGLWATTLFVTPLVVAAAPQPLPSFGTIVPASIDAWKAFRAAQPFQTQIIGLSAPSKTQPRTLIVSEPPPKVTWEQLVINLKKISRGCTVQRWTIMSGGWVQDIVCTLKDDVHKILPNQLSVLQQNLYGTTEGSTVVSLPATKRAMIAHSLDFRYNASDLHRWLYERDQKFRAGPIAESVSLRDILEGSARGAFQNNDRALTLWAFDRTRSLDDSEAEFRRFALNSDLVLGAVANSKTVIVVGRGRVESLAHLPPLRSETVLLLAGSSEGQLAQSYERMDLLAGKGLDGIDRAPIFLSPQLVNTEFGNLLNLTDQLLKGWSMAGSVNYVDFRYPKPKAYPFGSVPAPEAEKHEGRPGGFLFNWNTDGAAYRQMINGLDVVVPQRTGALSVIYGDPQDRPRDLEDIAYDYFATSGDTSLIRVAQYTLLYQILRQFEVRAAPPRINHRYEAFAVNVREATHRQLKLVMNDLSTDDLYSNLREYWVKVLASVPDSEFSKNGVSRQEFLQRKIDEAIAIAVDMRNAQAASNGQLSGELLKIISRLREKSEMTAGEQKLFRSAAQAVAGLRESGIMAVTAEKLGTWASLSPAAGTDQSWNHTAYVVESKGSATAIGGHNIDAPLVRFRNSTTQTKGEISVSRDADGQLVVTHNPSDTDRLRDIARQVGTRKELAKVRIEAEVNTVLKNTPPDPPVPFSVIRSESSIAAAKSTEFTFLGPSESGYRVRPLMANERELMSSLKATNEHAIVFEQLSDGSFVMTRTGADEALHVASITAATDALANGLLVSAGGRAPVTVLVKGVADAKTEAMLTQIQSSLRRYPKETVQHVLSAERNGSLLVERPALLNAKIVHNGIHVERGAVKVEQVTSGIYKGFSRVEVPVTIQAKTPWHLRIIFFVKNLTKVSQEILLNKLASVIAALKGPVSMADVNLAVQHQLRDDLQELGVDAVLLRLDSDPTRKMHDMIIAADPTGQAHVG